MRYIAQVTFQTVIIETNDDEFKVKAALADYFRGLVEAAKPLDKIVRLTVRPEGEFDDV